MSVPNALEWTMGLKNRATGKYLTQEAFGGAVNVNGTCHSKVGLLFFLWEVLFSFFPLLLSSPLFSSPLFSCCSFFLLSLSPDPPLPALRIFWLAGNSLRQKQTWTLVSAEDGGVHLRSYLGKYLYGDRDGNIKCDAESPSAETQWTIQPQPEGTWALISSHNYYFHGTGTKISAFLEAKEGVQAPSDGLWVVHLAMHPQINLYNLMRKRYVHLDGDELVCDEDIPWGEDALLNLIFFGEHPDGRYGIQASNGKYLENSGKLVDQPTPNCQFLLGFHDNQVSFLDAAGSTFPRVCVCVCVV